VRRLGPVLAAVPLIALLVWILVRSSAPPPGTPQPARPASAVLPSASAVDAAGRSTPARFGGDGVYEYLDGGAEIHLARGLRTIVVARYLFAGEGGGETEIEAAAMGFEDSGGAAASAADLRPANGTPVDGLAGAVAAPGELVMVRGRWLLRLLAVPPGDGIDPRMVRLAAVWSAMIGGPRGGS